MESPLWIDHLLALLFGVVLPFQAIFHTRPMLREIEHWDTPVKLTFYRGNNAFLWVMAFLVVSIWLLVGRPLSNLGLQWPPPETWRGSMGIALLFTLAYSLDVWRETATPRARRRTRDHFRRHAPFLPENQREWRAFRGVALSAAVGEEVVFRGFFITYVLAVLGDGAWGIVAALLAPTFVFAASHAYQGWKAVIKIALLSLAFAALFLLSGSLLLPVVLHLLVDLAGGWLAFKLLSAYEDM
jgi:membrane protease YdiL (CAAX protease family)